MINTIKIAKRVVTRIITSLDEPICKRKQRLLQCPGWQIHTHSHVLVPMIKGACSAASIQCKLNV